MFDKRVQREAKYLLPLTHPRFTVNCLSALIIAVCWETVLFAMGATENPLSHSFPEIRVFLCSPLQRYSVLW